MRARCCNKNNTYYPLYGGRGVRVCDAWLTGGVFQFAADVGLPPTMVHTLDRIDNDGHYEPSNVRWATPAEQSRNMRTNRMLTLGSRTQCIVDWARELGLTHVALRLRLEAGWSLEKALVTQPFNRGQRIAALKGSQ